MADFALRPCYSCKADTMSRVSEVRFQGRIVRTTQCWRCGRAVVEKLLTLRQAIAAAAVTGRP